MVQNKLLFEDLLVLVLVAGHTVQQSISVCSILVSKEF